MVISLLDIDLTWTVCNCCLYNLLNSMLNLFGYSVYNFKIQNLSFLISHWIRVSLELKVFVYWSIMVNFAFLLKLWLSCWKCFQAITALTFFTSLRWWFSLILKLVSAFPLYCLLRKVHSSKYITRDLEGERMGIAANLSVLT